MKSGRLTILTITLVVFAMLTSCSNSSDMLVSVNGKKITQADLDFLGEINPRTKSQLATPYGKSQILNNLIERELLLQASVKAGLQKREDVKGKINLYKEVIIAQAYLDDRLEKEANAYYEKNPGEFEHVELSHILVKFGNEKLPGKKEEILIRTEKGAEEIAKKLKDRISKGELFEEIAKSDSEDKGSASKGGSLGLVAKNDDRLKRLQYDDILNDAFTMKVGDVIGPIKSKVGYHLLKLTRGAEMETLTEALPRLKFKLKGEIQTTVLAELKKDAKIELANELQGITEESHNGHDHGTPAAQTTPSTPKTPEAPTEKSGK